MIHQDGIGSIIGRQVRRLESDYLELHMTCFLYCRDSGVKINLLDNGQEADSKYNQLFT
jgi:hypothetical protein